MSVRNALIVVALVLVIVVMVVWLDPHLTIGR
jgi:hypothetical protein